MKYKGGEPELLETLLSDGQQWTTQRLALRQAVLDAHSFARSYCERHDESAYLEETLKAIDQLSVEVSSSLDQLDRISRDLIQMVIHAVFGERR